MRRVVIAVLAGIAVVGFAAGAYGGWVLWHPMDAVLIWLVAIGILLAAGVLALIRRRPARLVALALAVAGIALVAGDVLGPSRPPLDGATGRVEISTEGSLAATGSHDAFCQVDAAGTELQVSGDSNLRLDLFADDPSAPADLDQREFVGIGITVGDRWRSGPYDREDDRNLQLWIGHVTDGPPEIRLVATDESTLEVTWTRAGGSARFSDLTNVSETPEALDVDLDLAGTITWTCDVGLAEAR